MTALLFSSYAMRDLRLANRIVVSPMAQYSATPEGHATAWHLMHVGNLAVSGAGLVIMEATAVEPRGRVSPRCLGLWTDAQAEALRPVVAFCREHGGAALGLQLAHAGRKGSVGRPWEGQDTLAPEAGGWRPVSSCELAYPGRPRPRLLSPEEMAELREAYVAAARRADALGFDLIELHAAHGYLLNCFLSPLANQRNDAYGGDRAGRMRFPLEVFAALRAAWPAHKPVGVRISATDWVAGGWEAEDSVAFARELKALGCDYVTASSGGVSAVQQIAPAPGYQVPFARRIQQEAGMPAMAVGLLHDPDVAERALQDGAAELVALGRGMMWEPRWAWHAAEALGCDYVTASSGGVSAVQQIAPAPGYQVPFARRIQQEAGMPAMAVGLLHDPDVAERALQDGAAELVALGRGMMWEPRWAWHAAEALGAAAPYPPQYARSHPGMRFGDPGRPFLDRRAG